MVIVLTQLDACVCGDGLVAIHTRLHLCVAGTFAEVYVVCFCIILHRKIRTGCVVRQVFVNAVGWRANAERLASFQRGSVGGGRSGRSGVHTVITRYRRYNVVGSRFENVLDARARVVSFGGVEETASWCGWDFVRVVAFEVFFWAC